MNRKIKFRAWDFTHKKMITKGVSVYFPDYPESVTGGVSLPILISRAPDGKLNCELLHNVEIMQYTNYNDKHGKRICDGDIIRGEWIKSELINGKWEEGISKACHRVFYKEDDSIYPFANPFRDIDLYPEDFEIIGNIYENPELLNNHN